DLDRDFRPADHVADREYLVVLAQLRRVVGGDGHHPERGRDAVVQVGLDLRPLLLDGQPGNAMRGTVRQRHPVVILGDPGRYVPGIDQPGHDELVQRTAWRWPCYRGRLAGVPVIEGREDHSAAEPVVGVADPDLPERCLNRDRWGARPGVNKRESV